MNIKHTGLAMIAAIVLSLSSCIGIETEVRISADGTVESTLVYEVSIAVDQMGKLGANESYLPLPVGQDDLLLAVSRAGGELVSWNRADETDRFIISATVRFPTIEGFSAFLDPSGQAVSFSQTADLRTLSLQLSEGRTPADAELSQFIQTVFSDYQISISFELPQTPIRASNMDVDNSRASFSMPSAQLYTSSTPIAITLEW